MLPGPNRLRRREDFATVVRRGRRTSCGPVVLHWLPVDGGGASHVGFVVSRAVGPATVRNRVRRQLRHLVRDRLPLVAPAAQVVVRATPESATSSFDELGQALDTALSRARRRPVGPGAGAPAADRSC